MFRGPLRVTSRADMIRPQQSNGQKVSTGILGFDEIAGGGLPRGRTTLLVGGAGCGKTVFALQSLVAGSREKEPGVFVAFEEDAAQIVANAVSFGWGIEGMSKKKLFFFDARLSPEVVKAGQFDLVGMLALLKAKVEEIGAKRIVFDGIDVLLGLLDDPAAERREIYRIRDWLVAMRLTGIITQKAHSVDAGHHYDFLQFMADCVVTLRHQVIDGASHRSLRVTKYRGSSFSADEYPLALSARGVDVTPRGPSELVYRVSEERISSGLERLDGMLDGGYYRGSNVLISGAPGTAKSTLGGLFAESACKRGERTLYVSFDEGAAQIVRNLRSVGIRLAPHQKSGLLKMFSTRTRTTSVDEQFRQLHEIVNDFAPRCVVIDPFSALSTKAFRSSSVDTGQRFLDFLRRQEITVLNTSLLDGLGADEATATAISTVADTWIHLSYVAQDGERNRALTIVKSRGMAHSNQVRELTLSAKGVSMTDVFIAQGKVLMGVARWEREQSEAVATIRAQIENENKRLQLEVAQAEAAARMEVVKREMEARRVELANLSDVTGASASRLDAQRNTLKRLRRADSEPLGAARSSKKSPPRAASKRGGR